VGLPANKAAKPYCPEGQPCEHIVASYVKFLESQGARVVPISYYAEKDEVVAILSQLNGVFFTGGGANIAPVHEYAYDFAIEANDAGDYFPIWGTCLGFEFLIELAGAPLDHGYQTNNMSLPLIYTQAAASSRMLDVLNDDLLKMLADPEKTSAYNYHSAGIDMANWGKYAELDATFQVLATSVDPVTQREFVAVFESPKYPFYAVQWHPEKNAFELGVYPDGSPYEAIVHTPEAIDVTMALSQFFVNEACKNDHAYESTQEMKESLIWNYPIYSHLSTQMYMEIFVSGRFRNPLDS